MVATKDKFKGNPIITLRWDESSKFPFSFGIGKAKLILKHIDEIKQFVAENDKPQEEVKA